MDSLANTPDITEGIYDIYPPAVPDLSFIDISLIILSTLIFIAALSYIVWLKFFSVRAINQRRIRQLQRQFLQQAITPHDAIYQLCDCLKKGLALKQIDQTTTIPPEIIADKKHWDNFNNEITQLRYKNKNHVNNSRERLNTLFSDALYWLKIWPK